MTKVAEQDTATQVSHTPGPWNTKRAEVASDGGYDYAVFDADRQVIAEVFARTSTANWPPVQANAHLISAAPELLAAVKWHAEQVYAILSSDSGGDIPSRIIAAQEHVAAWRVAVAKAEGR